MVQCPTCGKKFATKIALRDHVADSHKQGKTSPAKKKKTPGSAGPSRAISAVGAVGRLAMEEYLGTCKKGINNYNLTPGKTTLARLDKYALMYEQYRYLSLTVRFTVRVGSTVSGMYLAGPSYVWGESAAKIADVAALSPKVHAAVWQPTTLNIPVGRIMKQKWLRVWSPLVSADKADSFAVNLSVYVDGDNAEVDAWVSYNIEFTGSTNVSSSELVLRYDASKGQWFTEDGKVVDKFPDNDGSWSVDIEATFDKALDSVKSFFKKVNTMHHVYENGLYYAHVLVDGFNAVALAALSGNLILHARPSPFRPALGGANSRSFRGNSSTEAGDSTAPGRQGEFNSEKRGLDEAKQEIDRLQRQVEILELVLANRESAYKRRIAQSAGQGEQSQFRGGRIGEGVGQFIARQRSASQD